MLREYLWQNPEDELRSVLKGEDWDQIDRAWGSVESTWVVHHIYRASVGSKYDVWPLVITVDAATHHFCHRHPKLGVVACVWVKLVRKQEFDREMVKEVTGRDLINIIQGWKMMKDVDDPHYLGLIDDIENHADTPPARPMPFTEFEDSLGEEG